MTRGILAYGTYVPYHRLARETIASTAGIPAGTGTRAVASHDEDTTSLAVEAGVAALATFDRSRVDQVVLATSRPAYLDKTNATAAHAALHLASSAMAYDAAGSLRSAVGAMHHALAGGPTTLLLTSDIRYGLVGGPDELQGGDGAAAILIGEGGDLIAECIATSSATDEFVHRWRRPEDPVASVWEERFGEHVFAPLVEAASHDALKQANLTVDEIDRIIVTGSHSRAVQRAAAALGVRPEQSVDGFEASIGNTGTAHPALLLGATLDEAAPGETILLVVLSDGADATVLRTTDHLTSRKPAWTTRRQIERGNAGLPYSSYLTWRGLLDRESPRRPEPTPPAAPPSYRHNGWKYGLVASRCTGCGTVHLPPREVCQSCASVRTMEPLPMSAARGRIVTFTVDRLAFSLAPPVVSAIVDFDDGGRLDCELTDIDPADVRIGLQVEMTFRRLFTAGNLHNYFWKARPARKDS